MIPDVNVIVMDFHNTKSREMVTENSDGSCTIFINARLNHETQLAAYEHALKHINDNDFQKLNIQEIELAAHGMKEPTKKEALSDFHKRILAEIRKSRKKIKKELEEIDERNRWMERNDPGFFQRMEGSWLEQQRLGDI